MAGLDPMGVRLRRPEQRPRYIRPSGRHARPWAWHPRVGSRGAAENAEERPHLRVSASPRAIFGANSWMPGPGPGPSPGMTVERLRAPGGWSAGAASLDRRVKPGDDRRVGRSSWIAV